jgi:transposase
MENDILHSKLAPQLIIPIDVDFRSPTSRLVFLTQKELTKLKWAGNYWKAQFERAVKREEQLKKQLEEQKGIVRDLQQRVFGKKSEKNSKKKDSNPNKDQPEKRKRGSKKGSPGHGRTSRPDLPIIKEKLDIPRDSRICRECGLAYSPFPGDEESDIFEVQVKAHIRRIVRKCYKKSCSCPHTPTNPGIIVALPAPKVIPKSPYGISIWEQALLGKFLYAQPLNRILMAFKSLGLPISQGTVTGGLRKLLPLFEPIEQGLYEKQMLEKLFHNDESRWDVFEAIEGKVGHRWYLWVTRSQSVIFYNLEPTRSADVPMAHFSRLVSGQVVVVCDRYSAYKKLARLYKMIILAFCWAHVRRDFLDLARNFPKLEAWGLEWVDAIGKLYYLNQQRLEHWEAELSIEKQSIQFQSQNDLLQKQLQQIKERCDNLIELDKKAVKALQKAKQAQSIGELSQVNDPDKLEPPQRKVLTSLQNHWKGLTIFVDRPQVPMDNNSGERAIRNPVCGRKNYYGSGSIWSAQLAARMFSIFQTIEQWGLNARHWLREYLTTCANNGGQSPEDISDFLPWYMSQERQVYLSKPPPEQDTS